jgi:hypothetical protein
MDVDAWLLLLLLLLLSSYRQRLYLTDRVSDWAAKCVAN